MGRIDLVERGRGLVVIVLSNSGQVSLAVGKGGKFGIMDRWRTLQVFAGCSLIFWGKVWHPVHPNVILLLPLSELGARETDLFIVDDSEWACRTRSVHILVCKIWNLIYLVINPTFRLFQKTLSSIISASLLDLPAFLW